MKIISRITYLASVATLALATIFEPIGTPRYFAMLGGAAIFALWAIYLNQVEE